MNKILLCASYSVIEPLGIIYLSEIAKEECWDCRTALIKDYEELRRIIIEYNPNIIGYTLYSGNTKQVYEYLDKIEKEFPSIRTLIGGPHATYFPDEVMYHCDHVIKGEGFFGLRQILKNKYQKDIIEQTQLESFPIPNRSQFYNNHPKHNDSPIKSVITKTGCPYKCTYCYNSKGQLFPHKQRPVDDIIKEIENIIITSPNTKMIYFQDDVFGADIKWLEEFTKKYNKLLPYHAQSRFEFVNSHYKHSQERLYLLDKSGCTGITFAIESGNSIARKEILNRPMDDSFIIQSLACLRGEEYGFKVRTEQMLGLPLGATSEETPINLEADLKTLELNVILRERTELPDMAWVSIFTPYKGTVIYDYCKKHGFFSRGTFHPTFFEKSNLNFVNYYVGPELKKDHYAWMNLQELRQYKKRLVLLRDLFNYFALIPKGHLLAKDFLYQDDLSFSKLSYLTRQHLYNEVLYKTP